MKVALVFPRPRKYIHNETFEPLGLLYIASNLYNHDVKIIDCFNNKMTMDEAVNEIEIYSPDVVGISLSMSPTVLWGMKLLKEIRKINKNIITVAGGTHATFDYESLIKNPCLDYIILNEGEITFRKLLENIETKKPAYNEVTGLVYKEGDKIVRTAGINIIEDLDMLNFPARNLLGGQDIKRGQILTSRGCVYKCIYCAATAMNNYSWRKRNVENIFEEILLVSNVYGNKFYFADDNFTVDNKRVIDLCRLIIDNNLKVNWSCLSRVENIKNKEILSMMKEAGCYEIFFGIESGSEKVLKKLGRNYNSKKVTELVDMCNEIGINTTLSFIIGLPFEQREDVLDTLRLAENVASYNVAFHIFTPYPGTDAYNNCSKYNIELLVSNYDDFDKNSYPIINTEHFTAKDIFDYYCEGFGVSYQKARQKSFASNFS